MDFFEQRRGYGDASRCGDRCGAGYRGDHGNVGRTECCSVGDGTVGDRGGGESEFCDNDHGGWRYPRAGGHGS